MRTENRYGQTIIESGSSKGGLAYALYRAIDDAIGRDGGKPLFDQIQINSEIEYDEDQTWAGAVPAIRDRNVLTVRLPVVFDA